MTTEQQQKKAGTPLKLISKEDETFETTVEIMSKSGTISNMMEDLPDVSTPVIPLPNISSHILKKVIEWCEYHYEHPILPPIQGTQEAHPKTYNIDVPEWDKAFLNVEPESRNDVFAIILAANYLDIVELLNFSCAMIASLIRGRNVEQVKKEFNITKEFTEEEMEKVRKDNAWCDEP